MDPISNAYDAYTMLGPVVMLDYVMHTHWVYAADLEVVDYMEELWGTTGRVGIRRQRLRPIPLLERTSATSIREALGSGA